MLLAAAVAVWSVVAWRLLSPTGHDAPQAPAPAPPPSEYRHVDDTLRADYPDPFLKQGAPQQTATPQSVVRPLPPRKKALQRPDRRPTLVHLAAITGGGRTLHVLTVDNVQYELHKGDTVDGWRLVAADRDSIYLEREGSTYGVKRCE